MKHKRRAYRTWPAAIINKPVLLLLWRSSLNSDGSTQNSKSVHWRTSFKAKWFLMSVLGRCMSSCVGCRYFLKFQCESFRTLTHLYGRKAAAAQREHSKKSLRISVPGCLVGVTLSTHSKIYIMVLPLKEESCLSAWHNKTGHILVRSSFLLEEKTFRLCWNWDTNKPFQICLHLIVSKWIFFCLKLRKEVVSVLEYTEEKNDTYSESRIGSELQETFDSRCAQIGCGDVESRAKIKVTAGGINLYKRTEG